MTVSYHVGVGIEHGPSARAIKPFMTEPPLQPIQYIVLKIQFCLCTRLLEYWNNELIKRKEFLQEYHSGKRKRRHPEEDSVSISGHLTGCNWNPNNGGGSMVAAHLDQDCSDVYVFGPLLKLWSRFRTQRLTGIAVSLNLTASLPDVVTLNKTLFFLLSIFNLALLIGLLRMDSWTCLGEQVVIPSSITL